MGVIISVPQCHDARDGVDGFSVPRGSQWDDVRRVTGASGARVQASVGEPRSFRDVLDVLEKCPPEVPKETPNTELRGGWFVRQRQRRTFV